jgi:hypothetical protein
MLTFSNYSELPSDPAGLTFLWGAEFTTRFSNLNLGQSEMYRLKELGKQ